MQTRSTHLLFLALACIVFPAGLSAQAQVKSAGDFDKVVVPFLQKHCYQCHGPTKKKADIAFHLYKDEQAVIKDRKVWHAVQDMVHGGEMPPQDRSRPTVQETDAFLVVLQDIFLRADRTAKRDPGQVTMRRLNRAEYKNTIQDLLGVAIDVNDLPQDDVGYGFDNIGDVLTISPLLMERYLATAESIVPRAFPAEAAKPEVRHMDARFLEPAINPRDVKGGRPVTKGKLHTPWKTTEPGEFKLRVRCSAVPLGKDPVKIALEMDGKDLGTFEIMNAKENPQIFEVTLRLTPGEHRGAVRFLNDFEEKEKKHTLSVNWLELVGPMDSRPTFQAKVMDSTAKLDKKERTRAILKTLASHAYRRPASADEVERLAKLVEKFESKGDKWEPAMQVGFQAILCSPKFLFRVELDHRPDSAEPHPLDEHQLASRLSYFLWSSMPDEELFALAEKKQLHANLDKQVRRLLQDPRAGALIDNFGMQWLQLRNLKTFAPDPATFPDWDEALRTAMLKETELFLQSIVREDRSILDLIDADFTFLNERLGRHYGIVDTMGNRAGNKKVPGGTPLRGPEFKRVKLQGGERGGILTQASILTVNSNPTRTSPVKRGRWVLEQILGTPPPPPPPNVPELPEGEKAQTKGSLRQRMEQHRANPSCAFCHARMDPIGFAFENFNGIGQFRSKDGDFAIDPAGTLPNGQSFKGPGDLKVILKGKKELFGRSLTEKLLTFATGRGLEYYDRAAIDKIVAELGRNDYRFSVLVAEVVKSDPFRLRRGKDQK
jgi:Protein of unknown function (DUF1592)/Protein of unknown function (DUF1588)/Protein of unknown function (DUF1585)/Protein of unknown function (DUF1587)/Protein of unknown function (DUF1595)/Planctomycete cytochrome C